MLGLHPPVKRVTNRAPTSACDQKHEKTPILIALLAIISKSSFE
jgi:hypothetical protein